MTPLRWLMALLAAGLIAGAFALDAETAARFKEIRTKPGKKIAGQVSHWGDAGPLVALSVAGFGLAAWRKNGRWQRIFAAMLLSGTIAGLAANASRLTTGRTRPNNTQVEQGWYGLYHEGQLLIGKNKFNAFPSGHTAFAFGFFGVLAFSRRWPWAVPGLAAAAAVGLSRLYLGVHHLSDATTGMLLGLWVAWWAWGRVERWKRKPGPPPDAPPDPASR